MLLFVHKFLSETWKILREFLVERNLGLVINYVMTSVMKEVIVVRTF